MGEELQKLPEDTVTTLRTLAHELSNALENVMQAAYLLGQSKLGDQDSRWLKLIKSASEEAARINREIREILRSRS